MASRVPHNKHIDRCLHPVTIIRDGQKLLVPCGKCSACRLIKANDWSRRLVSEIGDHKFSIYFTLTYSNEFLPVCVPIDKTNFRSSVFVSDNPLNKRFDGVKIVPRKDDITVECDKTLLQPISRYPYDFCLPYCSKRDIQLYLKLIRKDLYEKFSSSGENYAIRYYIISELGSTTYRPHYHGIIFCDSFEVAEYLSRTSLFKNWSMCDRTLFDQHVKFCNGGVANYLTNYITQPSELPQVYKETPVATFRLASKNPPIGFLQFDKAEVSENVCRGIITYCTNVHNVNDASVFCYPSSLLRRLFPLSYRYRNRSFERLLSIYGILYRLVVERFRPYEIVSSRLRERLHPSDWVATKACFDFCLRFHFHPHTFLYLVDMADYKIQMSNLKRWYEYAEKVSSLDFLMSYQNLVDYCRNSDDLFYLSSLYPDVDFLRLRYDEKYLLHLQKSSFTSFEKYSDEVGDILVNSVKSAKTNELLGLSANKNF